MEAGLGSGSEGLERELMKIEYSSNNSGGGWWLSDENWKALEKAGWAVEWKKEKWLGALATSASKDFPTVAEAIREFESVTAQDASDEGCNCCGPPHSFSWDEGGHGYASGSDCLQYMFRHVPSSLREAAEQLNKP